jgi:dienelactone hydrolase
MIEKAGVAHGLKRYQKAGHAFFNGTESGPRWSRPLRATHSGPEPESAADGRRRSEAFFAEHPGTSGKIHESR